MKKSTIIYSEAIKVIKNAILRSRYRAAALANKELLSLYYGIGKYISDHSREGFWGKRAIETISEKLQKELPGLRGFSPANIKRMRQFYEAWEPYFTNKRTITDKTQKIAQKNRKFRPLPTDEIYLNLLVEIRPMASDEFQLVNLHHFLSLGFSHHYELLIKTKILKERLFYIEQCFIGFWNVESLRYHLKSKLYLKHGKMPNNFRTTIKDKNLQQKALMSFKDEYLLDYINIESTDDEPDERVLESKIVGNIRKFIMSLGKDFSFIGNQYRLIVEEQEYFIDLLFFNRQLQALVAIELKQGYFKPEYLGKMNFYLSALDDIVRLPHENPSIGIILCKTKKHKIVEYAFRDMTKPMGVATLKIATKLPSKYRNILPNAERLKELL
jgi:predicted nuclease of restriction endonuclease-like (RecB) superfamily